VKREKKERGEERKNSWLEGGDPAVFVSFGYPQDKRI
jgi:hypothetical protein